MTNSQPLSQLSQRDGLIQELKITQRASNCLRHAGNVETIGQLRNMSDTALRCIPGLGISTLNEIRRALAYFDQLEAAPTARTIDPRLDQFAQASLIGFLSNPNLDAHMKAPETVALMAWTMAHRMIDREPKSC